MNRMCDYIIFTQCVISYIRICFGSKCTNTLASTANNILWYFSCVRAQLESFKTVETVVQIPGVNQTKNSETKVVNFNSLFECICFILVQSVCVCEISFDVLWQWVDWKAGQQGRAGGSSHVSLPPAPWGILAPDNLHTVLAVERSFFSGDTRTL